MQCTGCPLVNPPCADGVGNKNAKIAVVGRNPGKQEAKTGVPFTGPSGQLLDATLQEAGLSRDDLWITNAVSCHVESDDGPTKEMYDICRPRLMSELADVNPVIVLSLGNEATQSLLGSKIGSIMKLIGSMHPLKEVALLSYTQLDTWVLPTFHPAYILRGSLDGFDDLLDAVKRSKRLADGATPLPQPLPYEKVHYLDTNEKVLEVLLYLTSERKGSVFAIDTETNFVRDPTRELLLVQIGDDQDAWVFEARYLIQLGSLEYNLFRGLLQDPDRTWIFHNSEFDIQYILHYWGEIAGTVHDTMALALCLSEKLQHCGLKRLVNTHLSVPHYEQALSKYIVSKKTGYSAIPREILVPYAGFDVIFTYRLYPVLVELVRQEGNLETLYPLLVGAQKLFAEMAYNGIRVDLTYKDDLRAEYIPLIDKLEIEMQAYAHGLGFKATDVVANAKDWPFLNVRSTKQLMYFLNTYCGFKTDTTNVKFMEKNEDHEFIQMLLRFRKVDHLMSAYIEGISEELWPDSKVHPDFVHGTVTGRTTIEHPALQTLPGDDFTSQYKVRSIRKMFVPDSSEYRFVHADYSQLEIRVAWHITGDPNLGKAVMTKDMHRTMAALVYNKEPDDITDFERSRSKLVTFGMLYGRRARSIAAQMKCTVEEAQAFLNKFSAQFPIYFGWWEGRQTASIETGVLSTEFGRRRRWTLITPETEWEIMRQAVNFPIQSTASDICLSSMIKVNKELKSRDYGRALFSVHDSIEMQIREGLIEEACLRIKEIMEHPFEKTCAIFKVKIGTGRDFAEASSD